MWDGVSEIIVHAARWKVRFKKHSILLHSTRVLGSSCAYSNMKLQFVHEGWGVFPRLHTSKSPSLHMHREMSLKLGWGMGIVAGGGG